MVNSTGIRLVYARDCNPDVPKSLRKMMIKASLAKELPIAFNKKNFMIELF